MKNKVLMIVMTVMFILPTFAQKTYPGRAPMTHEMTEYWLPQPSIVTPGQAPEMFISAPSDAIVLFDGKDLTKWENSKEEPAECRSSRCYTYFRKSYSRKKERACL